MVWDVVSGKLRAIFNEHSGFVNDLAASNNGQLLASAGADSLILLWDVASGSVVQTLRGHSGQVNRVLFTPDGKLLASAGDDGQIIFWDVTSGQLVRQLTGSQTPIHAIAISPMAVIANSFFILGSFCFYNRGCFHFTNSISLGRQVLSNQACSGP